MTGFDTESFGLLLGELFPDRAFGAPSEDELLADIGLDPISMLVIFAELSERGGFEFPEELLAVMETVGDLLYFNNVRIGQELVA